MKPARILLIGLIVCLTALLIAAQAGLAWAVPKGLSPQEKGSVTPWDFIVTKSGVKVDIKIKKCVAPPDPTSSVPPCASGALWGMRGALIGATLLLPIAIVPLYLKRYEKLALGLMSVGLVLVVVGVALWFVWQGSADGIGKKSNFCGGADCKYNLGIGLILTLVAFVTAARSVELKLSS